MRSHDRATPSHRCSGCIDREKQHGAWWCENCFFEPFPSGWPHYCDDVHAAKTLEEAAVAHGMELHEIKEK